jgi:hypothetical protein
MAVRTATLATLLKSKVAAVALATVLTAGTAAGTTAAANGAFGQEVKAKVES